jgi:diguanylate cyclase (GGDEF)-like protein
MKPIMNSNRIIQKLARPYAACFPVALILLLEFTAQSAIANSTPNEVIASYPFSYQEIREAPELKEPVFDWPVEQRIDWLKQQKQQSSSPVMTYFYHRLLVASLFYANQHQAAWEHCLNTPPMKEDIYYRWWCIDASNWEPATKLELKLNLSLEAQQLKRPEIAAMLLAEIGWLQSQAGDIGAAFASYEKALEILPKDQTEIALDTMFNVASLYIVHGDDKMIRKGIGLLEEIRDHHKQQQQKALAEQDQKRANQHLQSQILSLFNIGIAYTLHLYDYPKALATFDEIIRYNAGYKIEAASFAAIAASELKDQNKVEHYLTLVAEQRVADQIINDYLECYRELALRYFNARQNIDICFQLSPQTTTEVTLDVYKRIANLRGSKEELMALRALHQLLINKIEPELKQRAAVAASRAELKRLETESQLKSQILQQEQALKQALAAEKESQQQRFLLTLISMTLIGLIIVLQLRQKKKLAEQFEQLSLKDGLTELGNRRFLEHNIQRELAYVKRHHKFDHTTFLAIYLFDIDHFKRINDRYGHDAGDAVLVEFSRRLKNAVRETDLLTRWGGEEFIFVGRVKTEQEIYQLAERLRDLIKCQPFKLPDGSEITVTCTIGAVRYPFFDDESLSVPWQQLVSLADMALYWGKNYRDVWAVITAGNLSSPEQIPEILTSPIDELLNSKKLKLTSSLDQQTSKDPSSS